MLGILSQLSYSIILRNVETRSCFQTNRGCSAERSKVQDNPIVGGSIPSKISVRYINGVRVTTVAIPSNIPHTGWSWTCLLESSDYYYSRVLRTLHCTGSVLSSLAFLRLPQECDCCMAKVYIDTEWTEHRHCPFASTVAGSHRRRRS